MVELPMHYHRKFSHLFEPFGIVAVRFGVQSVASRGFQNILRIRAVARNSAVLAYLLQRDPPPVVREYHRERSRAAFERLHLHNDGNLRNTFRERLFYCFICHSKKLRFFS